MNLILQAIKSLFRKIDNKIDDSMKKVIPIPNSAKVGQYLSVKAVDNEGRPTEWCTNFNAQPNWHDFDSESKSYIINNPLRMDQDVEYKNIFLSYENDIYPTSIIEYDGIDYALLIYDFNLFGYVFTKCRIGFGTTQTPLSPKIGGLKTYPIPHFGKTSLLNKLGIAVDIEYDDDECYNFCICKYDNNKICAIIPRYASDMMSIFIDSIDIQSSIKIDPSYVPGYELSEDYELIADLPSCDFYPYGGCDSMHYRDDHLHLSINKGDNIVLVIDQMVYKGICHSDDVCGNPSLFGQLDKNDYDFYLNCYEYGCVIAIRCEYELIGASVKIYKSNIHNNKYNISLDYIPSYDVHYDIVEKVFDSELSFYPYNQSSFHNIDSTIDKYKFHESDMAKIVINGKEYINKFVKGNSSSTYCFGNSRLLGDGVNLTNDDIYIRYTGSSGEMIIALSGDAFDSEDISPASVQVYKLANKQHKIKPNFLPNSNPLVLYAVRDNTYPQLYLNDSSYGDQALKAIMEGRQILIRTPNKDMIDDASAALNNHNSALFSPVLTYHVPNYENDYLYLYYLRDEKNTLDLSAAGAGIVEIPIYGELKLKLSKQYMECPIEHKTPEEYNIIINESEASTVEELPDTTEEEEQT